MYWYVSVQRCRFSLFHPIRGPARRYLPAFRSDFSYLLPMYYWCCYCVRTRLTTVVADYVACGGNISWRFNRSFCFYVPGHFVILLFFVKHVVGGQPPGVHAYGVWTGSRVFRRPPVSNTPPNWEHFWVARRADPWPGRRHGVGLDQNRPCMVSCQQCNVPLILFHFFFIVLKAAQRQHPT